MCSLQSPPGSRGLRLVQALPAQHPPCPRTAASFCPAPSAAPAPLAEHPVVSSPRPRPPFPAAAGPWAPPCPGPALPTSPSIVPLMKTSRTTGPGFHFLLDIRGRSRLVPAATSWGGFMSPFYSGGNTGPERLSYSPKVTSWLVIGPGSEPRPASALHPISLTAAVTGRAPCPQPWVSSSVK